VSLPLPPRPPPLAQHRLAPRSSALGVAARAAARAGALRGAPTASPPGAPARPPGRAADPRAVPQGGAYVCGVLAGARRAGWGARGAWAPAQRRFSYPRAWAPAAPCATFRRRREARCAARACWCDAGTHPLARLELFRFQALRSRAGPCARARWAATLPATPRTRQRVCGARRGPGGRLGAAVRRRRDDARRVPCVPDPQPPQRQQVAQRAASALQGDFSALCVVRGCTGRARAQRW